MHVRIEFECYFSEVYKVYEIIHTLSTDFHLKVSEKMVCAQLFVFTSFVWVLATVTISLRYL